MTRYPLLLASLSRLDDVPRGVVRLFIVRHSIEDPGKYGMHLVPDLAPSAELLNNFKRKEMTWVDYVEMFRREMVERMTPTLRGVLRKLEECPVAFICFCKAAPCHRYMLANYFIEVGIRVIDLNNGVPDDVFVKS